MNKSKKTAKKKAATKKNGEIAPMPKSRLAAMNKQRIKDGKPPLDENGKEVKQLVIPDIAPSKTDVQEIVSSKLKFKEGGVLEVVHELEPGEGVSLISFFDQQQKHAGLHIGTVVAHLTKKDRVSLEAIAKATGLKAKTLQNLASAVRSVTPAIYGKAIRAGESAGHDVTVHHIQRVQGAPKEHQERILMRVATEGLTVSEVAEEARKVTPATKKGAALRKAGAKRSKETKQAKDTQESQQREQQALAPVHEPEPSAFVFLDTPLSPEMEAEHDANLAKADEVVTYVRGENFKILPRGYKQTWLTTLKQLAGKHAALLDELTEVNAK